MATFNKIVDGVTVPIPKSFDEKNVLTMSNLAAHEGDVIISTYPKCGTNWAMFIVWSLQHPYEEPPDGEKLLNTHIPYVDLYGLGSFADVSPDVPRTLITHLPQSCLNYSPKVKYITVARNPMDSVVSSYRFLKSLGYTDIESNDENVPAQFFDSYLDGDIIYGDIFHHIKGWYNLRNESNVHFVTYEELKKDLRGEILRIAKFLGLNKPLEGGDGSLLDKIEMQCTLNYMKTKYAEEYRNASGGKSKVEVIRKGQVGGYKKELTGDQVRRMREKMERELEGTELLDQWKSL